MLRRDKFRHRLIRNVWPANALIGGYILFSEDGTMLSTILIVILILILIGALPSWPYSASWGYGPGGLVGTILVIVLILALLGRI